MRYLILSLVAGSLGNHRAGYNAASQLFVIRAEGPRDDQIHQIMYGQVNKCQEFFRVKEFVNDEDSFVEFAKQTDVVSCTEPSGSAEIIDAYGITAKYVCSPGLFHRTITVSCSAGSTAFGGFLIFIGEQPGCEVADAVNRCGGAFLKFRELTKHIQTFIHGDSSNNEDESRRLEEVVSTEKIEEVVSTEKIEEVVSTNEIVELVPTEEMKEIIKENADSADGSTTEKSDPEHESNPTLSSTPDTEPQESEVEESPPSDSIINDEAL
jgi:hypothetical protein